MNTRRCIRLALTIACFAGLIPTISRAQNEAAPKPRLVVQVGHTDSVINAVAFGPDSRTIASASADGTVKLWDVTSGQLLNTLHGDTSAVTCVCFSPDGKTVASGGRDTTAKLWDVATGVLLRTFTGHTDGISSVCFSPDGRILASGGKTAKLWDVMTGKLLRTLMGRTHYFTSVAFSPDGKTLASGGEMVSLWDVSRGKLLRVLQEYTLSNAAVNSVCFSPDGKALASGSEDGTIKLWNAASGQLLNACHGHKSRVKSVSFSLDGKTLAGAGDADITVPGGGTTAGDVSLWDTSSGRFLHTIRGDKQGAFVAFSPNGKTFASCSQMTYVNGGKTANNTFVKLWDSSTGKIIRTFQGRNSLAMSLSFSPDGKTLASGCFSSTVKLWDLARGPLLPALQGHKGSVTSVCFSPDGKTLASGGFDHTVKLWDPSSGRLISSLLGYVQPLPTGIQGQMMEVVNDSLMSSGHLLDTLNGQPPPLLGIDFSSNRRPIACIRELKPWFHKGAENPTIESESILFNLWDVSSQRRVSTLQTVPSFRTISSFQSASFSPDGRTIAGSGADKIINLWDVASGRLLRSFQGHTDSVTSVCFSPDGRTFVSGGADKMIILWNAANGRVLHRLRGHDDTIYSVGFSPDGKLLASGSLDGTIKLWNTVSGRLLRTIRGHGDYVYAITFTPDGKTLVFGNQDGGIQFLSAFGADLCTLYEFDNDNWAVVTPDGRFDGNEAGLQSLHYVVGLEPIDLVQLKSRYYEPGLLGKLLGFNKEPRRNVSAFDHVALYPEVNAPDAVPADGKLPLSLTNRGGGIGRVQVFVNGKELNADARGSKPDPEAKTAEVTVDVSHAPGLIPGQPNTVKVVTWNAEGYLSSRGVECVYTPPGTTDTARPELWAIVGGISDYAAPELHLTYPAKDAADFAHALTLAAGNLFGVDKVHLTLLDTGAQPGGLPPTKAGLQQAFAEARKAKPGDIFVVYLAGHGVALPGSATNDQNDLYCYLTADATTGDPAALGHDLTLRQATTVSSEELTDWIKQVPARKQVMVLDTCAAGAAAALLTAKRDVPSDQIRAIERLKDRTGFYVLMGCAADAASYETSRYRQGLLTYSLLKGMKGASLRDGQYVDVGSLFNYAVDEVPQLAQNIGGVQRPFVAAPSAGSFDMGELSVTDRQAIPLAVPRPMIVRPELLANDDDLDLERLVTDRFRDAGAAGLRGDASSGLAFVDTVDFPGAVQPRGTYGVTGSTVTVKLRLRRDGVDVKTLTLSGPKNDPAGLASKITSAIEAAIQGFDHSPD